MQKDGTYRVVYGTDLDKITGRVKLSVVGYGRSWSFLSLWGWVSARCGGVRTITSESWGVFDSHSTDAPLSISLCTVMVTIIKGDTCFIKDPLMLKNAMVILELGGSESNQQYLEFRGDDFDAV
jgi:hypothetical protein